MSTSVQFNGTDINNVVYISENTTHDSAQSRSISSFKIARRDGEKLVSAFWGSKEIDINGYIVGTSQADFESKADALKSLLANQASNLDILYNGITRRYIATATEVKINRDSDNIDWSPYSVKFLVPLGVGMDTSETTALNKSGIVATTDTETLTFNGSYNPKPRHRINFTAKGNADVIRVQNTTTGNYMDVDLGSVGSLNDFIEINEENQTVLRSGNIPVNYRGVFPSVAPGSNNLELFVYGNGYVLDQTQTDLTGGNFSRIYDNYPIDPQEYQSFVATKSGTVKQLKLYLTKIGSPAGTAVFGIFNDNNGIPGTQIASSYQADISGITGSQLVTFTYSGTAPYLTAGQRYWIRNSTVTGISGSNSSNYLGWAYTNLPNLFPNGKAMAQKANLLTLYNGVGDAIVSPGGVTLGNFDFAFQEYLGDGNAPSWNINWQIYYTPKYL